MKLKKTRETQKVEELTEKECKEADGQRSCPGLQSDFSLLSELILV